MPRKIKIRKTKKKAPKVSKSELADVSLMASQIELSFECCLRHNKSAQGTYHIFVFELWRRFGKRVLIRETCMCMCVRLSKDLFLLGPFKAIVCLSEQDESSEASTISLSDNKSEMKKKETMIRHKKASFFKSQ